MTYLKVIWLHNFDAEPIELLSELAADRMEVRKVERFRNGVLACAGSQIAVGSTHLAEAQVPTVEDITADPQFQPSAIDQATFEHAWRSAQLATAA